MADSAPESKRVNRAIGLSDALGKVLDPVLKKRGFATRDLVAHWAAIAPKPYDQVTAPERLAWPRGERSAEGAVLHLRCLPGHSLALAHEGERVAAHINRYFGYVLVRSVRISPVPFTPRSAEVHRREATLTAETRQRIEAELADVEDEGLRDALRRLGRAAFGRQR